MSEDGDDEESSKAHRTMKSMQQKHQQLPPSQQQQFQHVQAQPPVLLHRRHSHNVRGGTNNASTGTILKGQGNTPGPKVLMSAGAAMTLPKSFTESNFVRAGAGHGVNNNINSVGQSGHTQTGQNYSMGHSQKPKIGKNLQLLQLEY
jgi:hypothetical protein